MTNEQLLTEALGLIERVSRNTGQRITIATWVGEYAPARFYRVGLGGGSNQQTGGDIADVVGRAVDGNLSFAPCE